MQEEIFLLKQKSQSFNVSTNQQLLFLYTVSVIKKEKNTQAVEVMLLKIYYPINWQIIANSEPT